jgi:RNA polymerase sigma-70 factor, ECF subfamily
VEAALTSGVLLADARGGDASAFALLLDPLWVPAYRLAFSMLKERETAEDAVQEAALKAWRSVRSLRSDTQSLRPWFLTIVANECRSMRRNRWARVLRMANLPDRAKTESLSFDNQLDLRNALRALAVEHREALALRYYLDLPIEEVARVIGISVPGAKARIRRALKALGPELDGENEDR